MVNAQSAICRAGCQGGAHAFPLAGDYRSWRRSSGPRLTRSETRFSPSARTETAAGRTESDCTLLRALVQTSDAVSCDCLAYSFR